MNKDFFSLWTLVLSFAFAGFASFFAGNVHASTSTKKSLHQWAVCNGVTDDTDNVKKAIAAAKNSAFTLVVDCSALLHIGMDISRSIFIDNSTTIEFTSAGKFTVDNVMIPAFVIANTHDVTLTGWNVEWNASLPINGDVGGYIQNSEFYSSGGSVQPAGAFSEFTLGEWLTANRALVFKGTYPLWRGGIVPMGVLVLSGDTSNVTVSGWNLYVPANAGGDRFIPVAFGFWPDYKSNQTVRSTTPTTAEYVAVPHDLTFSNVVLDGTYMGFLGNAQHVLFENITSHRYGDLQDAKGLEVGGVGKWFAPPHLFYLNYDLDVDPALFNTDLQIKNVVDDGPRVGTARDKGGSDTASGYANSLKIGCIDCTVDTYSSNRPDGLMDILPSNNLVISNVTSTYDSSFLHNLYPAWRFPTLGYKNLTFENISLTDKAAASIRAPIGGASSTTSENITFSGVQQKVNQWATSGFPVPDIVGSQNHVAVTFSIADTDSGGSESDLGQSQVEIMATPTTVQKGGKAKIAWITREASSCSASGAWSGALSTQQSYRIVTMPTSAGSHVFTIRCQNSRASYSTSVTVVVQ